VAKTEIGLGQITGPENFRWQDWPQSSASAQYIQRGARPNAINDLAGSVARAPMLPGEPITPPKLVKPGDGGVLAAILPAGMRAVSTRIKEETAAGRLILPNDRVDVILTQRRRGRTGNDDHVSDTLFRNIRVLAIGQLIEAKDGKKLAEGNTATLEMTPTQSEELAAANAKGEISLALRSIADNQKTDEPVAAAKERNDSSIKMLKYGVRTRAYGVN
jgi:pilus assembly protein CpaB